MLYQDWDITLTGKRIRITPMEKRDEEAYAHLLFGPMYDTYYKLTNKLPLTYIDETLEHNAADEMHAIRPVDDDRFIGRIVLQKDHYGRPDIDISLIPGYQNQGICPEAVALFVNRLHAEYGMQTIGVRITEDDLQSQKAFAKVGAVLDQIEPHYVFVEMSRWRPDDDPEKHNIPNLCLYHIPLPVPELPQE